LGGLVWEKAAGVYARSARFGIVPCAHAFTLLLTVAAFQADRALPRLWIPCAVLILWVLRKRASLPPLRIPRSITIPAVLLVLVVVMQQIFLAWSGSPAMGPGSAASNLARLGSLILVFLMACEVSADSHRHWRAVLPILAVAALQAAAGVTQYFLSGRTQIAVGSYLHHSHYAALLALALPFAVISLFRIVRHAAAGSRFGVVPALRACGYALLSALILAGILFSASRSAFAASLLSLLVMGVFVVVSFRALLNRSAAAIGLLVALALGFALFSTQQMLDRFANINSLAGLEADAPLDLWTKALELSHQHPLLGCGLGAYAIVAGKPDAHSDYLQLAAELGWVGFAAAALVLLAVLRIAVLKAWGRGAAGQMVAMASVASLVVLILVCAVESALYVPANAMLAFWIAGMAVGVARGQKPQLLLGVRSLVSEPAVRRTRR
jgi:O-antigen ligase